jgi:hypothetical protein
LRSSSDEQLEKCLRSAFDSLEIYDDQTMCLDYIASIDRRILSIYLLVESEDHAFECENIKALYRIDSYENIKRLILQIRNNVRSDTTSPIRPIEKSAHRLSDRYAPFVSLMSHLDLYVALYRDVDDCKKMKEEMMDACRLIYRHDQGELHRIEEFDKKYSDEPDGSVGRAIFWYTRKHNTCYTLKSFLT